MGVDTHATICYNLCTMSFGIVPHEPDESEDDAPLTETDLMEDTGGELLPPEVTRADLSKYTVPQLNGRLAQYTRERLFERDAELRNALQIEIERTALELNRRAAYARAEAERVFK